MFEPKPKPEPATTMVDHTRVYGCMRMSQLGLVQDACKVFLEVDLNESSGSNTWPAFKIRVIKSMQRLAGAEAGERAKLL